jgi:uncharacterized protein DUF6252
MKIEWIYILIIVFFTTCLEEDISEKIEIGMFAKVGADSFATKNASFSFTFGNILRIEGVTDDSIRIIMELDSADQEGLYLFSNTAEYEGIYMDSLKNVFSTKLTGAGMVRIIKMTQTTVEGNFEFTARNLSLGNKTVSVGEFSLAREN